MFKILVASLSLLALAACGDPKIEVIVPLAIVSVSPHDGASGIALSAEPTVCFNREMDATVAEGDLELLDEAGAVVAGLTVKATSVAECLSLGHTGFTANTLYTLVAKEGLTANDGAELAATVSSHFRTAP